MQPAQAASIEREQEERKTNMQQQSLKETSQQQQSLKETSPAASSSTSTSGDGKRTMAAIVAAGK